MPVQEIIRCGGGARIEVYPAGRPKFNLKFYPEWLDHEDEDGKRYLYRVFHKKSFKRVTKNRQEMLVACPKRSWKKGKCSTGMVALQFYFPVRKLAGMKRSCKSGALSKKHKNQIMRIVRIIERAGRGRRRVAGLSDYGYS